MKKSDLTSFIKEEILSSLSENTEAEIEKTKELTAAIKDLEKAKEEAGIEEAEEIKLPASAITSFAANIKNPQTFASNILAVVDKLAEKENDTILKHPKLKRALDMLRDLSDDKQEITVSENASDADSVTYIDIGSGYLQGFNRPHSLSKDELETLGRKIVSSLYKGDINRAVGELTEDASLSEASYANQPVNKSRLASDKYKQANTYKKAYDSLAQAAAEKQFDDDAIDKKAIKGAKKETSLAKAAEELAVLTREMKSLAKKYSKAKGQEKEDLLNKLKSKTKLKKELDKILDK